MIEIILVILGQLMLVFSIGWIIHGTWRALFKLISRTKDIKITILGTLGFGLALMALFAPQLAPSETQWLPIGIGVVSGFIMMGVDNWAQDRAKRLNPGQV